MGEHPKIGPWSSVRFPLVRFKRIRFGNLVQRVLKGHASLYRPKTSQLARWPVHYSANCLSHSENAVC